MKKLLLFGLIAMTISSSFAGGIKWYSWDEGVEKAMKEKKPMMIFVNASWCHVCKKMNDKTFRSDDIAKLVNEEYIPVNFDIEMEGTFKYKGKEYSGKELLATLSDDQLHGIPSTLFYTPGDDQSHLIVGYKTAEEFTPILSKFSGKKK